MSKPVKAFALLSGGLDSILAARVVQEQGVEVIGVTFASILYQDPRRKPSVPPAEKAAQALGIELISFPKGTEFFHMIQHPRFGYGSAINPCIDCRIYYLNKVRVLMPEYSVSFVVTGEVLGQRPKSQMRDSLAIIERESGIAGRVVRPLCAKLLSPTIPETEGLIDREKLFGFQGRGRKEQMALAEQYGIRDYPTPAGGCPLTEIEFMPKVVDLFQHGAYDDDDIRLLSLRRHFRINPETRVILGRDQYEGEYLIAHQKPGDVRLEPVDFPGPVVLVRGMIDEDAVRTAAGLLVYYSKKRGTAETPVNAIFPDGTQKTIAAPVLDESYVREIKIDKK